MSKPEKTTTAVAIPDNFKVLAEKLNSNVFAVIGQSDALIGFEKAFQIATATDELKKLLTNDYMKPIMALQGNKLGFKTDKDDKGGYPIDVVKNCLIEAVLTGVQPFGNQFNIIAGNMYVTKEGFGYLLKNTKGLSYKIIPGLPRINQEKSGAAVNVVIKYTYNGFANEESIEIPVRMNAYMTVDAILGKATRKARAWLFNTIHDSEVADGDVVDMNVEIVQNKVEKKEAKDNAVKNTMAGIADEAKVKKEEDPSRIDPDDPAYK